MAGCQGQKNINTENEQNIGESKPEIKKILALKVKKHCENRSIKFQNASKVANQISGLTKIGQSGDFILELSSNQILSHWNFSQSSNFSSGIQPIRYIRAGNPANQVISPSSSRLMRFCHVGISANQVISHSEFNESDNIWWRNRPMR